LLPAGVWRRRQGPAPLQPPNRPPSSPCMVAAQSRAPALHPCGTAGSGGQRAQHMLSGPTAKWRIRCGRCAAIPGAAPAAAQPVRRWRHHLAPAGVCTAHLLLAACAACAACTACAAHLQSSITRWMLWSSSYAPLKCTTLRRPQQAQRGGPPRACIAAGSAPPPRDAATPGMGWSAGGMQGNSPHASQPSTDAAARRAPATPPPLSPACLSVPRSRVRMRISRFTLSRCCACFWAAPGTRQAFYNRNAQATHAGWGGGPP
jgi:hypothetical protein